MRNYVLTLLLAVLVVLTGLTVRRSILGAAKSGADRRTSLMAIGSSPVPVPPPALASIGSSPVPVPPPSRR